MWLIRFALICATWSLTSIQAFEDGPEFEYDPEVSKIQDASPWPRNSYKSSNLRPPVLKVNKTTKSLAPGYYFITPEKNHILGALMYDSDGELVWGGFTGRLVSNLKTATFQGQKVLSTWVGRSSTRGFGYGGTSILNHKYKEILFICPRLGLYVPKFDNRPTPECQGDLHESEITSDGSLLVTAYNVTQTDLTAIGGPRKGWTIEGQFHRIDLATKKVTFSWKSLQHVPVTDSQRPLNGLGKVDTKPYDYLHINSVEQVPGRNQYLVSGRHTSSIYLIDGTDGSVIWTFSGTDGGDFAPLPNAPKNHQHFAFQHDPRVVKLTADTMTISIFNNFGAEFNKTNLPSTGLIYKLNTQSMTADLIRVVHDREEDLFSLSQGSAEVVPTSTGNHYVIGYGFNPVIKEFGPRGTIDLRWSARFGQNRAQQYYRAFKDTWVGTPSTQPSVAVEQGNGYVSWNGATQVTRYVLIYGKTQANLNRRQPFSRTGFETTFKLPTTLTSTGGYLQVAAYHDATLLRKSTVHRVQAQESKA